MLAAASEIHPIRAARIRTLVPQGGVTMRRERWMRR
jgi:hypothetical protein